MKVEQLLPLKAKKTVVKVTRRGGLDKIEGAIIGVGKMFALFHRLENNLMFDGYAAVPLAQITHCKPQTDSFLKTALRLYKQTPALPPNINLDSLGGLLDSVEATGNLITLYTERTHPGQCYIGFQIQRIGTHVVLFEVDPKAKWGKSREYPLRDITLVEFGGAYESALQKIAGPPPVNLIRREHNWWMKQRPEYR